VEGNVANRSRLRARLVGAFGIIPGLLFLVANYTDLGHKLYTGCGYWALMLTAMGFVLLMYVFLIVRYIRATKIVHMHSHGQVSGVQQSANIFSIVVEALITSAIIVTSMLGFALFELRCVFGSRAPQLFENLPLPK